MYPCSSSLYPILSSGEERLARGRRRVTRVVLGVTRWLTAKRQTDVSRTFCSAMPVNAGVSRRGEVAWRAPEVRDLDG